MTEHSRLEAVYGRLERLESRVEQAANAAQDAYWAIQALRASLADLTERIAALEAQAHAGVEYEEGRE